ncbi:hypothetical protein TKK_0009772 [Trichogramma kaykai]
MENNSYSEKMDSSSVTSYRTMIPEKILAQMHFQQAWFAIPGFQSWITRYIPDATKVYCTVRRRPLQA